MASDGVPSIDEVSKNEINVPEGIPKLDLGQLNATQKVDLSSTKRNIFSKSKNLNETQFTSNQLKKSFLPKLRSDQLVFD